MIVKVCDTDVECKPFSVSEPHTTFLQLSNEVTICSKQERFSLSFAYLELGVLQRKKFTKSEITMEVGGSGIFLWKIVPKYPCTNILE